MRLTISSLTDNIRIVESFIDNARDEFNINDDIYGNILIAVTESVNNAIVHGNKEDKFKKVEVSLELQEHDLLFTISDEGEGFNYEELPDPTAPENLLQPGGRGLFLIKNLADEVLFLDKGRIIQLKFQLVPCA